MTAKPYIATGSCQKPVRTKDVNIALWLVCPGSDPELETIKLDDRRKSKSAISAVSDARMMGGRYINAKISKPGMHVFSGKDLNALHLDRVGVVHESLRDNELLPAPAAEICHRGWANVNLENSKLIADPPQDRRTWKQKQPGRNFKEDSRDLMAWKHTYIDYILGGHTLVIWIAHIRPYMAKILETWGLKTVKARWDARSGAINSRVIHDRDFKEAEYEDYLARKQDVPVNVDQDTGEIVYTTRHMPELMVPVLNSGHKRKLSALAPGAYRVHDKRGQPLGFTLDWDPNNPTDNLGQWQVMVNNGYKVAVQ